MIVSKNRRQAGFTLVELIISIAIVAILGLMFFSIFVYNLNTFNKAADQSKEQASLRLVSLTLSNELRNIRYIDLNSYSFSTISEIGTVDMTDHFIFMSDNLVKRGNSTSISNISDTKIDSISFSLRKELVGIKYKYFLGITLVAKYSTYTTELLLNNIIADSQIDIVDIGASGISLQYNNVDAMPL